MDVTLEFNDKPLHTKNDTIRIRSKNIQKLVGSLLYNFLCYLGIVLFVYIIVYPRKFTNFFLEYGKNVVTIEFTVVLQFHILKHHGFIRSEL